MRWVSVGRRKKSGNKKGPKVESSKKYENDFWNFASASGIGEEGEKGGIE